jgi:hypothetical protein
MSSAENTPEPTVLTLDSKNSVQILSQYVELAQQKGAFLLNEAELLKRATDVLLNNVPDQEINQQMSIQLLIQGVNKGQKHGAYTLNDASLLSKVVQFISTSFQQSPPNEQQSSQQQEPSQQQQQESSQESNEDDLADLADPIPLKPKEV